MKTQKINCTMAAKKLLPAIMVAMFLFSGCEKADMPDPDPAPDLPPEFSMLMNFSDFSNVDTTGHSSSLNFQNWDAAASYVFEWKNSLDDVLTVPTTSFMRAFKSKPHFDNEFNAWAWEFEFTSDGKKYGADLRGIIVPDGIQWEMYVSLEGLFTDYLWYSGFSDKDNTKGNWVLNTGPEDPGTFLLVNWTRNAINGNYTIKYTNISSGNPQSGSYILYEKRSELMDASYTIYSSSTIHFVKIHWSHANIYGQITDARVFEDELWHCWDETRQDTACD
ncbi:MAG: hypothetical protein KQI35_09780 [Bacteroidetes bacterium]|nr:hypothetical protein [Bacteroidota bacterium]